MASYAALLSVMQTIHHIQIHPRPPISLDQQQLHSLTQNLTFFQHFLERFPTQEDDELESRIAAAAYAAEDVIETHIVDQIDHAAGSISHHVENITSVDLYGGLERVIQDMDLIKTEVMEIMSKEKKIMIAPHNHLHTNSSASTWQSSIMPVFDDAVINQVLDKLTGQQSSLQIISIVGMGGIGKTTFATYIYRNPLIVQHFDILAWVTISQEYTRGNILQLLCQEVKGSINGLSQMSEDEIGEIVYKHLWGRRYLIVMDDIWSVEAWDKVKFFVPDNNIGSRIMITTRLSNLAFQLSTGCHVFQMQFLDEDKSWDLLCKIVFGKLDCPIELENIGKEIATKCRGLPLSTAVIGGLLKKSNITRAFWMYTLENLNLLINLENDEYGLRILRTSYKELPMHLKPCFLYMGVFPEDDIKISVLIELWVAEGILRPINDKSLEEVGKEYLKDLVDRNLILISEFHWEEKARFCKIHDLLRDVCLREAQKQKFFCVVRQQKHHSPKGIDMERRICLDPDNTTEEYSPELLHAIESASLTRSLLYKMHAYAGRREPSPSVCFRLMRVYSAVDEFHNFVTDSNNAIFKQANLRYLSLSLNVEAAAPRLLSLCSLLWNLQTLKVYGMYLTPIITSNLWEMPLLRHVMLEKFALPDPPNGEHNIVLEHLQTLSYINNFKFSEEVIKRIPNIKKLDVNYELDGDEGSPNFCLNNLGRLRKLKSLKLGVSISEPCDLEKVGRSLVRFPHSLKKLSLQGIRLNWEDLTIKIGSLPLLQVLKLYSDACVGPRWETVEGQFCSLRVLEISALRDLKYWETDSAHFPCLDHLLLQDLEQLEEIPSSIGDIPTLKSIRLEDCNRTVADSAKRIKEEQEENGNEDLQVVIDLYWDEED